MQDLFDRRADTENPIPQGEVLALAREVGVMLTCDSDTSFCPQPVTQAKWARVFPNDLCPPAMRSRTVFTRAGVVMARMDLHWRDGSDGEGQRWTGEVVIESGLRKGVSFGPYFPGSHYPGEWTVPGAFRFRLLEGMRARIKQETRDRPGWPLDERYDDE